MPACTLGGIQEARSPQSDVWVGRMFVMIVAAADSGGSGGVELCVSCGLRVSPVSIFILHTAAASGRHARLEDPPRVLCSASRPGRCTWPGCCLRMVGLSSVDLAAWKAIVVLLCLPGPAGLFGGSTWSRSRRRPRAKQRGHEAPKECLEARRLVFSQTLPRDPSKLMGFV